MRKVYLIFLIISMSFIIFDPSGNITKSSAFKIQICPRYLPVDCVTNTTTPGNGTPFATFVVIEGFQPNKTFAIKSRVGPYISSMTYAISWKNITLNKWAVDETSSSDLLKITTDSLGNWRGWIIAKVKNSVPSGTLLYRVRLDAEPYGGNYTDSFSIGTSSLNMSTQGGWIEGFAYKEDGSFAVNYPVVVKDGDGIIVGTYLTEDNGVLEGYPSSQGYYKLAVPAGGPYIVELHDPVTNVIIGKGTQGVEVFIGQITSGININEPVYYNLSYKVNGDGSVLITPESENGIYLEGTQVTLNAIPDSGYHFVGWSGDVPQGHETDNPLTITMDADKTFTAIFEIDTFTITASAGTGGTIDPSDKVEVDYGNSQSFTITPNTGYHIKNVLVDGISVGAVSTHTFNNVTSNHTIEAQFEINTYTITASANSGGTITPSGLVAVAYGSSQTFTITPNTGYHIKDVLVDGSSVGAVSTYTFNNVTSNHTIEAQFEINTYNIKASVGTGGTISLSGTVQVTYGSNKSFTIEAYPGFFIYRILVDNIPINFNNTFSYTYTFTNVTSNHTIEAQFMKLPDITPPTLTLPTINGINLDIPGSVITTNLSVFTFTVSASDDSGIARMVVKVNGVVQIDKNNLDPTIYLSEGENEVEVTVYDTYGNYTTKSFKVISDTNPPVINLTVPETSTSSSIKLTGTILDYASGIKEVLVNDTPHMVSLSGMFEATVPLNPGVNSIIVKATDKTGNSSTKTYSVTYTPITSTSMMVVLKIDNPYITINGTSKKIDSQGSKPMIKDGRTFLPIRTLIESLGGTVEWDAKERKVTITLNGHSIILWIGKTSALVDGSKATLDVASFIIDGRTYLPLRFISENLGASVQWDPDTKTITIYYWK